VKSYLDMNLTYRLPRESATTLCNTNFYPSRDPKPTIYCLLLIGYQGILLDLEKLPLDQLSGWFHIKSRSCLWGSGWFWGVLP
jgi:hypothetical protein